MTQRVSFLNWLINCRIKWFLFLLSSNWLSIFFIKGIKVMYTSACRKKLNTWSHIKLHMSEKFWIQNPIAATKEWAGYAPLFYIMKYKACISVVTTAVIWSTNISTEQHNEVDHRLNQNDNNIKSFNLEIKMYYLLSNK